LSSKKVKKIKKNQKKFLTLLFLAVFCRFLLFLGYKAKNNVFGCGVVALFAVWVY